MDLKRYRMNQEEKEFPIVIVMITHIIILLMYLWTYKYGSVLLWGFFIIERLLSFSYEDKIEAYLQREDVSEIKGSSLTIILISTLLTVGIFLYTPFEYPGLFWILIAGELIDWLIKKAKNKLIQK